MPERPPVLSRLRTHLRVASEQLDFDEQAAREDDLVAQVRALVAEPSMTDGEIEALVEDALGRMSWRAEDRGLERTMRPKLCGCIWPLVLPNAWLARMSCVKCGRRPRGRP